MISKRSLIIGIIVFCLIVIGLIVYFVVPKAYVKFSSAPQEINVSIDGGSIKRATNEDTIIVAPGQHIITVSQNEFDSYAQEINITNGQTYDFLVVLNPLTDAARELLKNDKSQVVIERFSGKKYTEQAQKITISYPILSILPIQARLYIISACSSQKYPDDSTKIALCVDADTNQSGLEPYVLKDIQSRGYNPADYEIIWKSYSYSGE